MRSKARILLVNEKAESSIIKHSRLLRIKLNEASDKFFPWGLSTYKETFEICNYDMFLGCIRVSNGEYNYTNTLFDKGLNGSFVERLGEGKKTSFRISYLNDSRLNSSNVISYNVIFMSCDDSKLCSRVIFNDF